MHRSEYKYLISPEQALRMRKSLQTILQPDVHCVNGAYPVRSLYFDSIHHTDLHTKRSGTEMRKKIRLRVYTPEARVCKLEMKQKYGDHQRKVSVTISKEDALRLINGDFGALFPYFDQSDGAKQIYATMVLGCYRPVVLVEYERIAYTHPLFNTRICFDYRLSGSESCFDLFAATVPTVPVTDHSVILEVKYTQKLLGYVSKVLNAYSLERLSISKYCMCRTIFEHFSK